MGKEWIRIKETGQLYVEKVIVSFDIPILFVCNDFENRKYLCLNVDDEKGTTVIAETDNKTLISMLKDNLTMESVFRNALNDKIIVVEYDSVNEELVTRSENSRKISSDLLPDKGAFLELSNKMISDYISFLGRQLIKVEVEKFCEKRTIIVQPSKYHTYFSSKNENIISCSTIRLTDTKKKCSYDIDGSKRMIA